MQVVNVKLKNGVFVPLEPISIGEEENYEAVVVISEKRVPKPENMILAAQDAARRYFKEQFPDLEIKQEVLQLVGVLSAHPEEPRKEEYYEYLGRKYS